MSPQLSFWVYPSTILTIATNRAIKGFGSLFLGPSFCFDTPNLLFCVVLHGTTVSLVNQSPLLIRFVVRRKCPLLVTGNLLCVLDVSF